MSTQLLLALLVGALFIFSGLFLIRAKDMLWRLTELSLRFQGISAERTEWWSQRLNLQGLFFIIVGCVIIALGLSYA
jgi:hypothetical protein